MSMKKETGLYRISPFMDVKRGFFDFEKNQIGPYHVVPPIGYLEYYAKRAHYPESYLYKLMYEDRKLLAVWWTNEIYVAKLYKDSIDYYNIQKKFVDHTYALEPNINTISGLVQIGWMKTIAESVCTAMLPFALMYKEDSGFVYTGTTWIQLKNKPMPCTDVTLYKKLVVASENKDVLGVFMDDHKRVILLVNYNNNITEEVYNG